MSALRVLNAPQLAEAILLFWKSGPWTHEDEARWKALTGLDDVTGKALGDLARVVLEAEVRIDLGPTPEPR